MNGDVEFQCQMVDIEGYELKWFLDYDPGNTSFASALVTAAQNRQVNHYEDGHGNISLEYKSDSDNAYSLTLRISNVQVADEGSYTCGYEENQIGYPIGDWANLTVVIPPDEQNPRCSFSPNPISLTSATDTETIELTCEMSGGRPAPQLTWYRNSSSSELSTASGNSTYAHILTMEDDGVQFICTASGPALLQNSSCSITPFRIKSSASASLVLPIAAAAGGVIFIIVAIIIVAIVIWKCRTNKTLDRERTDNGTQRAQATGPYVIHEIPDMNDYTSGQHLRPEPSGTDRGNASINDDARQHERSPSENATRSSKSKTTSPYATNVVGNAERINYADLDLPDARQGYPRRGGGVEYAVIEGEL